MKWLLFVVAICIASPLQAEPIEITGDFSYGWYSQPPSLPWDGFVNDHMVEGLVPIPYPGHSFTWPLDVMPETVTWGFGPYFVMDDDPLSYWDVYKYRTVRVVKFTPETISLRLPFWIYNQYGGAYRVQWAITGNGHLIVPEPDGRWLIVVGFFTGLIISHFVFRSRK